MGRSYLEAVRERVVVFDGATGTNLQLRQLGPDDFGGPAFEGCNEILVSTRPDVVADLHRSFFEVGCDVVETDSFGSLPWVLAEYGIAERAEELSRRAARIAREVADSYGPDRFVAGSLGPGTKIASLGQITFAEQRDGYQVAAKGLLDGGVDLFIIETVQDLLQAKAAIIACRRAMAEAGRRVPIQVQVTIETTGRMLMGTEIGAALTTLDALRPDVVGLNCATGPAEMSEHLRYLAAHARMPISVLPNAGLPSVVDGKMHYDLTPAQLAEHHSRFVREFGISVVGGCCGTTPDHLRAVVDAVAGLQPATRHPDWEPGCASIYSHVPYDQAPSVLVVGERTNANGSKKFREAMLADDWDTCVAMARDAVKGGAHVLDVCVDYTGEDGVSDISEVVSRFATQATLPIMLDSTEPQVIEAGLERIAGKPILNSVNLEDGDAPGTRLDRFLTLAAEHGAAVVCTCIDETGQARTPEHKLAAAKAIHDLAVNRYGLAPEDLIFDPLALTLGTGMEESRGDGMATLEGIRRIKAELPGVRTILGLSNISFGLAPAARHALNSVYLHECQQAGLDAAIVHAARIVPLSKLDPRAVEVCLDVIYDRRDAAKGYDPLSELLRMFEGVSSATLVTEDRSGWSVERRLEQRIIDGERDGLDADLAEALDGGWKALDVINGPLLGGMKVVGELFGSGQMQLPFVLQSAETMKSAVAWLEPHMDKADAGGKGRIVLATVKGDVHDIGKNLVDIIFTNNGYEVHNLGIKVALPDMIATAKRVGADAIGMSGLLVKSTLIMRENLLEMNEQSLSDLPVILGGAALTRTYVERDLRSEYKGRLFYGKDAFEGLHTMDKLMELKKSGVEDPDFGRALGGREGARSRAAAAQEAATAGAAAAATSSRRSPTVATDNEVPVPPFLGTRVEKGIPLDDIAAYINETALFRNQWGYRPDKSKGEKDPEFKERIRAELRAQLAAARASGVLQPAVAYGYFPVNSDGNDLIVWSDDTRRVERTRITFPRQAAEPWLSIADFFRPADSGDLDFAAMHVVTMGNAVSEETARLFAANRYQDYLYLHGLGVEMTEALAEYWHHRIREEWGFVGEDGPSIAGLFRQQYRGGRYSWGYEACPDLEDNAVCAELVGAERLGVEVSEESSWQFHPEQTTAAIICHHPQAKYFVVRQTTPVDPG
ncbi:methionine synthase [Acidiferrimicrobium sp. IK]|uniref:methionine synthase n=1 Tax=Acidiferrimicrobium sp. IK TaxID=2871700 RepID=UPI0021CB25D9|nr:methionine synthase [Acidiferrimicrobium sp. IK]MCU4184296.1 methionine synthase [Acidiferrimicrobium sp. IK]